MVIIEQYNLILGELLDKMVGEFNGTAADYKRKKDKWTMTVDIELNARLLQTDEPNEL